MSDELDNARYFTLTLDCGHTFPAVAASMDHLGNPYKPHWVGMVLKTDCCSCCEKSAYPGHHKVVSQAEASQ